MTKEDIYNHYQIPNSDKTSITSLFTKDASKKYTSQTKEFNKKNKMYIDMMIDHKVIL